MTLYGNAALLLFYILLLLAGAPCAPGEDMFRHGSPISDRRSHKIEY
jgi:hypothetical protein